MSLDVAKDKHGLILQAAEQIMLEEGMDQLSMNKVARVAQVAKGTLYLYFDSKEAIIGELTIKSRRKLLHHFQQAIQQHPEQPLEQLRAICWACLDFFRNELLYADLVSFYEANTGLQETPALMQSSLDISKLVVDVVDDGQKKQLIRHDVDAASLSFIMWGTNVGMMHLFSSKSHHVAEYTKRSPDAVFHTFVELLIDGLKVK
ncbi:MAG: TetR/AcrR family transcriptional regulator [Bacteroidota bacterium]